ncbi:hypothetical protein [Fimbriimonas ginsengisoli]|uniref:5-bromo-4-chloroindolyl phosphate hydrolysis protein n=1 Tax=Fimbriimonas ginsengisoli Gsoil 348 TaxID=661478 RepID=A0A068NSI9_FIMGI|nr:hypothetical protein [Fimbriimonas ginsengisoli]AIE85740.1 hypothetical protein OP10G_2372 [Fimbriimonas ginsengisoli Gsoil 348]
MDDIRRRDLQLFFRELVDPMRLIFTIASMVAVWMISHSSRGPVFAFASLFVILLSLGIVSWNAAQTKRFHDRRMAALWQGCHDRLMRLEEVLKKMRRDQIADLREMPQTMRSVAQTLYRALRRADMVSHEVMSTERGMLNQPPAWSAGSNDPQSRELYRLADKNIAEYRTHFAGVMAGVQRTEAQSAVFMTTLDTLRMKIIGYRLVGRSPEMASQEFLEALAEARMQLQSIDTALEELDLGHYPKTISVVTPPAIPDDVQQQLNQGQ